MSASDIDIPAYCSESCDGGKSADVSTIGGFDVLSASSSNRARLTSRQLFSSLELLDSSFIGYSSISFIMNRERLGDFFFQVGDIGLTVELE